MLVSVCMLVYQQEKLVSRAIESVLCQKTDFDFEVIIGDDCSTDGTLAVLQAYAREYPDKLRIVSHAENVGPVRNAYDVLQQSRGCYLAFLEGDDFWTHPEKLQRQVDHLRAHPECSLVYHACRVIDAEEKTLRILREKKPITTLSELFPTGNIHMATSTMVGKNIFAGRPEYTQLFDYTHFVGDIILKAAYLKEGTIDYLDEEYSCYRKVTSGGANYSSLDKNIQRMDVVRAYRAVCRLYGHANARGATQFQLQVLQDVFRDYCARGEKKRCRQIFFQELTPYERGAYLWKRLLRK